jgi:hypothetical protein
VKIRDNSTRNSRDKININPVTTIATTEPPNGKRPSTLPVIPTTAEPSVVPSAQEIVADKTVRTITPAMSGSSAAATRSRLIIVTKKAIAPAQAAPTAPNLLVCG